MFYFSERVALSADSRLVSLSDILRNYQGTSNLASVQQVLQEGLKYAIEGGNATLVPEILKRNSDLDVPMDGCGICGPLRLGQVFIATQLIEAGCRLDVAACREHETFSFDPAHYAHGVETATCLH
jgi:hypothetical protein